MSFASSEEPFSIQVLTLPSPLNPPTMLIVGYKKFSMEKKALALALLEQGMSTAFISAELNVSRQAVYLLKQSSAAILPGVTPKRKEGR